MMLCRFGQLRNISVITYFTHSAALLQAVLQTSTESFRNGLVETRNRAVEKGNGLGTLSVPANFPSQMKRSKPTCILKHEIQNLFYIQFILSSDFFKNLQKMKNPFDLLFMPIFTVSARD